MGHEEQGSSELVKEVKATLVTRATAGPYGTFMQLKEGASLRSAWQAVTTLQWEQLP